MPSFNKIAPIKAYIFISPEATIVHKHGVAVQFQHN